MVCDVRLTGMPYGRRLRAALPPMPLLAAEAEALDWLHRLAGRSGAAATSADGADPGDGVQSDTLAADDW